MGASKTWKPALRPSLLPVLMWSVPSSHREAHTHLCLLPAPQLYLEGNPLWFHPAHRAATAQYLSPRARGAASGVSDLPISAHFPFPALAALTPAPLASSHPLPGPLAYSCLLCWYHLLSLVVLTGPGGLPPWLGAPPGNEPPTKTAPSSSLCSVPS